VTDYALPDTDDRPTGQQILVTGGAGFIGSHLVDALVPDNEVRVLDDLSSGTRAQVDDRAAFVRGDVADKSVLDEAVAGVDIVYHQAAVVSVAQSVERPRASHATNVTGTLAVLEAARRHDARVVFASSAAIYGEPTRLPIDESHPTEPQSPYGLEKLTADRYLQLYAELYGLETVPLRYFNVYGPRQTGGDYAGVIAAFLEQARAGGPLTVHGDGTQTRDFVHVEDVVQANLLAGTTAATGTPFNVGTGDRVSIRELAETVRGLVDESIDIVHEQPRPGDIADSEADITRARERLGYEPTIELQTGLATLR